MSGLAAHLHLPGPAALPEGINPRLQAAGIENPKRVLQRRAYVAQLGRAQVVELLLQRFGRVLGCRLCQRGGPICNSISYFFACLSLAARVSHFLIATHTFKPVLLMQPI
jgi:hypothetical protein